MNCITTCNYCFPLLSIGTTEYKVIRLKNAISAFQLQFCLYQYMEHFLRKYNSVKGIATFLNYTKKMHVIIAYLEKEYNCYCHVCINMHCQSLNVLQKMRDFCSKDSL